MMSPLPQMDLASEWHKFCLAKPRAIDKVIPASMWPETSLAMPRSLNKVIPASKWYENRLARKRGVRPGDEDGCQ